MATAFDNLAIRAWNMLADSMGGINLSGLFAVAEWLGIEDTDGLLDRLYVIKLHKPSGQDHGDT